MISLFKRSGSHSDILDHKLVAAHHKKKIPSWRQFKYVFRILSVNEQNLFKALAVFCGISLLLFGLRSYYRSTTIIPKAGGSYSEALIGSPQAINPIFAPANDVDMDLMRLIFSGLFRFDENQKLVNDLVLNYTVSEDQRVYTFYLRQDALWHDGETVNADDVVFTMRAIQDSQYKSPLRQSLLGAGIQKLTDYSLIISLSEPFAPFPSSLTFGILPEHRWIDIPPATANLAEENIMAVGSGPYKMKRLTKDRSGNILSLSLEANNEYHGQNPYIRELTFRFFPDIVSALDAMKHKNVDGISFLPHESRDELKKIKHLEYHPLRLPQYTAIFFNQKNSLLKNQEIRSALIWAIDRQAIVDQALGGEGELIHTPILPGFLGHNSEVEHYGYDPEKAKKILDDAGWALLEGEAVRRRKDQELAFSLTTVNQPEYVETVEIVKKSLEAIGLRVETKIIAPSEMQRAVIKPRNYEALLYGEIIGSDPDPYPFWHSSQSSDPGLNLAVFYDKDVDQLLEEARQTNDPEQRRIKYLHFQNILAEQLPAIFLYNPRYTYAVNKKVKGIKDIYISSPSDRFLNIASWYVKTERRFR